MKRDQKVNIRFSHISDYVGFFKEFANNMDMTA